jgi:hypothetical protein
VVGRFPNETSAMVMVFSLLEEEQVKWQKVGMRAEDIAWIDEASKALEQDPIKLEFLKEKHCLLKGIYPELVEGLTEMAEGYRIWLVRISTSYGTQPQSETIYSDTVWDQGTAGLSATPGK